MSPVVLLDKFIGTLDFDSFLCMFWRNWGLGTKGQEKAPLLPSPFSLSRFYVHLCIRMTNVCMISLFHKKFLPMSPPPENKCSKRVLLCQQRRSQIIAYAPLHPLHFPPVSQTLFSSRAFAFWYQLISTQGQFQTHSKEELTHFHNTLNTLKYSCTRISFLLSFDTVPTNTDFESMAASSVAKKSEYAKLKKNVNFHEKRMNLLLGSRVVEDMGHSLKERTEARAACAADCAEALKAFEGGAMEVHLSGKWSEVRLTSMFGLEVPLTSVVGSEHFGAPQNSGIADVGGLLRQMEAMAQRIPEFRNPPPPSSSAPAIGAGDNNNTSTNANNDNGTNTAEFPNSNNNDEEGDQQQQQPPAGASIRATASQALSDVEAFIANAKSIHWTTSDVNRIGEAIASKHAVLRDLNSLGAALRDAQYSASKEQLKLEELRRADEAAARDGEIATEEAAIRERLESIERLIDILFFQSHTIDSSIDSNVKKRRNNMSVFMNGAAVVQCIVSEKKNIIATCELDAKKIDRCVQYEEAHSGHAETRRRITESAAAIEAIGARQSLLQQRLGEIYKEWSDTEEALQKLAQQRSAAVAGHVELLDAARHAQSDIQEMCRFADVYKKNLSATRDEAGRAIDQLNVLERILLQQQTFETYDFRASAKRLATMQRRVAFDLNRALLEHQRYAERLLRRLDAQSRALSEAIDANECEAELRRDTLDPTTKKFVEKARELAAQRSAIEEESRLLAERVAAEHSHCMERIRQALPEEDVIDDSEKVSEEMMGRHEELLDFRQELVTPPEMGILDERLRVAREKQSTLAAVLQDTTRRSRILAIRNDIGRTRNGSAAGAGAGDASPSSASGAEQQDKESGTNASSSSVIPSAAAQFRAGGGSAAAIAGLPTSSAALALAMGLRTTTVVTGGSGADASASAANPNNTTGTAKDIININASSISNANNNFTVDSGGLNAAGGTATTLLVSPAGRVLPGGTAGRGGGGGSSYGFGSAGGEAMADFAAAVNNSRAVAGRSLASHLTAASAATTAVADTPSAASPSDAATTTTTTNGRSPQQQQLFTGIGGGVTSSLIASKAGGVLVGGITGAIAAANAAMLASEREAAREADRQALSARGAHHIVRPLASNISNAHAAAAVGNTTAESIDISAIGGSDGVGVGNNAAGITYQHLYQQPSAAAAATPQSPTSTSSPPAPSAAAHPTTTDPFAFNPDPEPLTTAAALREQTAAEERQIEAERLARLHGRSVDIFSLGRAGGSSAAGGGAAADGTAMAVLGAEDEASRRALVLRYRENEERSHRIRGKARAIVDPNASTATNNNVSVGDISLGGMGAD